MIFEFASFIASTSFFADFVISLGFAIRPVLLFLVLIPFSTVCYVVREDISDSATDFSPVSIDSVIPVDAIPKIVLTIELSQSKLSWLSQMILIPCSAISPNPDPVAPRAILVTSLAPDAAKAPSTAPPVVAAITSVKDLPFIIAAVPDIAPPIIAPAMTGWFPSGSTKFTGLLLQKAYGE